MQLLKYSGRELGHYPTEKMIDPYFLSKVKPIIFDMWDYYFRAFCDNPLDYNTYERIL